MKSHGIFLDRNAAIVGSILIHAAIACAAVWYQTASARNERASGVMILSFSAQASRGEIRISHNSGNRSSEAGSSQQGSTKSKNESDGGQSQGQSEFTSASMDPAFSYPPPVYPAAARRRKIEGRVLLSVIVTEDGNPENVTVHQSSGSDILDQAAQAAVKRWHFMPATRRGIPTKANMTVPIVFRLSD